MAGAAWFFFGSLPVPGLQVRAMLPRDRHALLPRAKPPDTKKAPARTGAFGSNAVRRGDQQGLGRIASSCSFPSTLNSPKSIFISSATPFSK
jgi:hypothetical protein